MSSALEQERDLIVERLHASREIYRQILATPPSDSRIKKIMPADFPRSRTFRWMRDHPWITTSTFAALIWLVVHRLLQNRFTQRSMKKNFTVSHPKKALLAISTIFLQNPSRLKTVGWLASTLLKWLKNNFLIRST